ncbi:MAG TPA: RibD family protein [Wenzhouxiangella sp.]
MNNHPSARDQSTPEDWLNAWPASLVVGQLGQSLDGRIATPNGHSHYINAEASRVFLHQIRGHVDAVVIGVGTALADQPRLDVRLSDGPNPARVVLDPSARMDPQNPVLRDDGTRVMVCIDDKNPEAKARIKAWPDHVEVIELTKKDNGFCPHQIIKALAGVGCQRLLIEGGHRTISNFVQANALDRLYLMIAPLIIGSGPAGIELPPIEHLDQAIRRSMRVATLEQEIVVEFLF